MTRIEKCTKNYIIIYAIVILFLLMTVDISFYFGEQDDYTLPTASMLNDGNFVISEDDWSYAMKLFPSWSKNYQRSHDNYGLLWGIDENSGEKILIRDANGEQLTWYFPVYSIFCLPFVLLLKMAGVSCEYGFRLANYTLLVSLLFYCLKVKRFKPQTKLLVVLALSINPIIFMLKWGSSETFLFSVLALSILLWLDKKHNLAALSCAIAGMVNTTVLLWGIVMIAEYMIRLYRENCKGQNLFQIYFYKWKQILIYALCYVPSLIPMVYYLYHIGKITPQGGSGFIGGTVALFLGRFFSYLFDLNFGMLPYFTIILGLFFIFAVIAAVKRIGYEFVCLFISCIGIMLCYSIHVHINCGMDAIARYNVWNAAFLCIGVPFFLGEILPTGAVKKIIHYFVYAGFGISALVLVVTWKVPDYNYTSFMPIANWFLDHVPNLYNPYHATFYNREMHVDDDGGKKPLPIIHADKDGYVRKILLDPESVDEVKTMLAGSSEDMEWLERRLSAVDREKYISIGKRYSIQKSVSLNKDDVINFRGETGNAGKYVYSGISAQEQSFTWTQGDKVIFNSIRIADALPHQEYMMKIGIAGTYFQAQRIIIKNRDETVYNGFISGKGELVFPITVDEQGIVKITMELPDAISPEQAENSKDTRVLSVALMEISFADRED